MARVIFLCGPAGSGKTTHARALERGGWTRLSFDELAWQQGHREMPLPEPVRARIEQELRERLRQLVTEDRDVVLDFSFWSRAMRDDWRQLLEPLGVVPHVLHLATPRDEVLRRLAQRRGEHPNDFALDETTAAEYFDHFQPPTPDEGPLTVLDG